MTAGAGAAHWDAAYDHGEATRSWFQQQAGESLRMLDAAGVTAADSVIDVGGGTSRLVDGLLARGYHDVTVLDVSGRALEYARERLGEASAQVEWIAAEILDWQPVRRYHLWHDRALLHFLTADDARRRYVELLDSATGSGAVVLLATFAPEGPDHCSGLPVRRYSADELMALLGAPWRLVVTEQEQHTTPAGAVQPFTWVVARRG